MGAYFTVIRDFAAGDLCVLRDVAKALWLLEPLPVYSHPKGPQRFPFNCLDASLCGFLSRFSGRCEASLSVLLGQAVHAEDYCFVRHLPCSKTPPHRDYVRDKVYWKIGVLITQAVGGDLRFDGKTVPVEDGDAYFFRADMVEHAISPVLEGERLAWTMSVYLDYSP